MNIKNTDGHQHHVPYRLISHAYQHLLISFNMEKNNKLPSEIRNNTVDYVTAGAKAALGMVPFAGSLLAEIAGSIIPQQRIDRIADFAAKLEARIAHLSDIKSMRQ